MYSSYLENNIILEVKKLLKNEIDTELNYRVFLFWNDLTNLIVFNIEYKLLFWRISIKVFETVN